MHQSVCPIIKLHRNQIEIALKRSLSVYITNYLCFKRDFDTFAHSLNASCVIKTEIAYQVIIHGCMPQLKYPQGGFISALNHAMGIH